MGESCSAIAQPAHRLARGSAQEKQVPLVLTCAVFSTPRASCRPFQARRRHGRRA